MIVFNNRGMRLDLYLSQCYSVLYIKENPNMKESSVAITSCYGISLLCNSVYNVDYIRPVLCLYMYMYLFYLVIP